MVQWLKICLSVQGHGFDPWPRKIPQVTEQRGPCATTLSWSFGACNLLREKPPQREAHTPQLEKAFAEVKTESSKNKKKKIEVRRAYYIWPKTADY